MFRPAYLPRMSFMQRPNVDVCCIADAAMERERRATAKSHLHRLYQNGPLVPRPP